eukprot:GDKI01035184.1.p1 GENE.GDKI01035184.1~~GDKI01035184.1.p1  ORF type:complete len:103 (-),score=22.16 GDKI01035184.1:37-345(-)
MSRHASPHQCPQANPSAAHTHTDNVRLGAVHPWACTRTHTLFAHEQLMDARSSWMMRTRKIHTRNTHILARCAYKACCTHTRDHAYATQKKPCTIKPPKMTS